MSDNTDKKQHPMKEAANSIIKNHMIWSMGAGFIPVPIADLFAVSAIQLDMVRQLSKLYDIDFRESEGKAIITSLVGSGLSRLGARAVKFIPGVGSILGGVTLAVLSGGSTYALGEVFKKHFETGGTFLDFDPSHLKHYYQEKFEKGKDIAHDLRKQQERAEIIVKSEEVQKSDIERVTTTTTKVEEHDYVESQRVMPKSYVDSDRKSAVDQLTSIIQMKKDGFLSDEEFEKLKAKIMELEDFPKDS